MSPSPARGGLNWDRIVDGALAGSGLVVGLGAIVTCWVLLRETFWGDPSIYFSFATNAAAGRLFQFNPGEFSSGVASVVWSLTLSVPFALGLGVGGAKLLSLAAAIAAFLAMAAAAASSSGSRVSGMLSCLPYAGTLGFYSALVYDSAVVLILNALSIALVVQFTIHRRGWALRALYLVWAVMPLVRPDLVLVVAAEAIPLWVIGSANPKNRLRTSLLAAAMLPSAAYYSYSWLSLGSYSVSNATRTLDQRAGATAFGPLLISEPAIDFLLRTVPTLVAATLGFAFMLRAAGLRALGVSAAAVVLGYGALLIVYPVTLYVDRYFLPAAPFVSVGIAHALANLGGGRMSTRLALIAVTILLIRAPAPHIASASQEAAKGYSFEEIVEREAVQLVNRAASHGASILVYEVQDRFFLRSDLRLLALNGLTDGKIAPYIPHQDVTGFLYEYRPEIWIANDRVHSIPYLRGTVLEKASTEFELHRELRNYTIDGVRFELVARRSRPIPDGFAGWQMVLRLTYETDGLRGS